MNKLRRCGLANDTGRWTALYRSVPPRLLLFLCLLLPGLAQGQAQVCPQLGSSEEVSLPAPEDDRLILSADQAEITEDGLSTLAGTVRLVQGGNRFEAQALSYDPQARHVRVQAESLFRNRDLIVRSQQAEFDLANETGAFQNTEFTLVNRAARGAADSVRLAKDGTVEINDVYYTTCPQGSRAWFLEASDIELDREAGLGRARHARLRFGYVPILYAPWFQFPIDDRRRSGLLFPTLGTSDNAGLDLRVPLYLNLAPNYDAQLTPRYMSDRGTQLGAEGRYLFQRHTGRLGLEYLDKDRARPDGDARSYYRFEHQGLVNRRLAVDARYGKVSDTAYFEDLGQRLEASSITHLERNIQFTYAAPAAYTITARIADYQTVSEAALRDPKSEPYQRLPDLRIEALTRKARLNTRLGLAGQYVNFVREAPPEGQRLDLSPFLRFQVDRSAWYAASQIDWRYTRYVVTAPPRVADRGLPRFSLDSGLRFERLTGAGELQTLEPRLYYLYVPFRDQEDLPLFDTGEPDFDFVQLFARNRYSGEDRISDANHVAFAFTSRLLDPDDGMLRLSASLGQIYRFAAPRVRACNSEQLELCNNLPARGGTDLIGELDYRLLGGLRFTTAGQWSQDDNEFVRGSGSLRYRNDRGYRADLTYRYRRNLPIANEPLEQTDLSTGVPLFGGWSALGRWRFSREDRRTLEALAGLSYETCCWAVRGAYRRYQFAFDEQAQEPQYTTGLYLQLELKGLTRIGAGFQTLLPPLD